jgi:hypothetical protein
MKLVLVFLSFVGVVRTKEAFDVFKALIYKNASDTKIMSELSPELCMKKDKEGFLPLHMALWTQASDAIVLRMMQVYPAAVEMYDGKVPPMHPKSRIEQLRHISATPTSALRSCPGPPAFVSLARVSRRPSSMRRRLVLHTLTHLIVLARSPRPLYAFTHWITVDVAPDPLRVHV